MLFASFLARLFAYYHAIILICLVVGLHVDWPGPTVVELFLTV